MPRRSKFDLRPPYLRSVTCTPPPGPARYPFAVPAFRDGFALEVDNPVTFVVGENGCGKSTLLEALAYRCEFNVGGGSRNHRFLDTDEVPPLAPALKLRWLPKVTQGFFLRAESFFDFATYIDELAREDRCAYLPYGGKSLHVRSHGESFLALFENKFERGIFLLDEPEAALSPQRQLSFLAVMHELVQAGSSQFIIATHSPMILAYPGATILSMDGPLQRIAYHDTAHYQVTKGFLDAPEVYFRHLFEPMD